MRTLTAALTSALGAPVTRPAFLVQIDFSTPRRWSTWANVMRGADWFYASDVRIEGLQVEAGRVRGSLVVGNLDNVIGALVLNEGVSDRRIRVWGDDAGADTAADLVLLADAVGGAAQIAPAQVAIALRANTEFLVAPRLLVGPAAGINTLVPAGAVIKIAGVEYRLERR
ncbi:MAG: hypothetical protein RR101_13505 [Burkholderiaceae bacterium]